MSSSDSTKLYVTMFPWVGFGHFIPYLYLSNKLAERGHRVSFLLPKGAQAKLHKLNHYPDLIHFYPLLIPHVDGLPPGAETASDVPYSLLGYLMMAFDQTQDQVKTILTSLKPDFVFFDLSHWMPALAHLLGSKAIYYSIISGVSLASICKKVTKDMTNEELLQPPPGYPCLSELLINKEFEIAQLKGIVEDMGTGMSLYLRTITGMTESDAMAFRTYNELEGPYCDYIRQHYAKPVLLTGPVMPQTLETKLDERWANWLSNSSKEMLCIAHLGAKLKYQRNSFRSCFWGLSYVGNRFWWL
ncbi:anthocyanidin 3-O-glucoside 2'''-O-xylosyltransferase-like [Fagus crenata]